MRTLLICHEDDPLNREGLARWLASFSELAGIIILHEDKSRTRQRVRKEIQRVGWARFFFDVLPMRLYYRLFWSRRDTRWAAAELDRLCQRFPPLPVSTQTLVTPSPNSPAAEAFVRRLQPDLIIARCKTLLAERIFTLPRVGTFVMHPGICPEYRNSHGCFWALASNDLDRVGMTLLRIDKGVDTGPVFGYYSYPFDEPNESHIVIQHRVVFENLAALREKLLEIHAGQARPLDVAGRASGVWGQPWLSRFLAWRRSLPRPRP